MNVSIVEEDQVSVCQDESCSFRTMFNSQGSMTKRVVPGRYKKVGRYLKDIFMLQ